MLRLKIRAEMYAPTCSNGDEEVKNLCGARNPRLDSKPLKPTTKIDAAPVFNENEEVKTMTTILRSDLTCPSCIQKIKKQVSQVPNVNDVTVHFATGRISVDHDAREGMADDLLAAVRRAGYDARVSAF